MCILLCTCVCVCVCVCVCAYIISHYPFALHAVKNRYNQFITVDIYFQTLMFVRARLYVYAMSVTTDRIKDDVLCAEGKEYRTPTTAKSAQYWRRIETDAQR